jgi:cell division protein ZapA
MATSQTIHVEIHGHRYALRTDLEPQYIADVAAYLDDKMRLAARELTTADPLRVAVIAALNITDELFRARSAATTTTSAESRLLARTADLERIVDQVLKEAQAG